MPSPTACHTLCRLFCQDRGDLELVTLQLHHLPLMFLSLAGQHLHLHHVIYSAGELLFRHGGGGGEAQNSGEEMGAGTGRVLLLMA